VHGRSDGLDHDRQRTHTVRAVFPQELNDSSAIIGRQVEEVDFASMVIDQFEEMRQTAEDLPLVMSVILHCFISGQPFRLRVLRRALEFIMTASPPWWLTQPGAIARQFQSLRLS
jgi:hypothetical protein